MTTADNWKVDADGDWSTPANWSLGHTPTSANTVTISTAEVHTITHSGGSDVIDKLTVGNDFFDLTGGSLDILTTASFADGYTQTGGTLTVGAISITGPAQLLGGGSEGATFTVTGTATLSNYTLGGSSSLVVNSIANQTGQVALGDVTGVNAAIKTAAAGVYSIAGDFGISQGASSASFTNAGTLRKISGSGASVVAVSVHSTGTISAASGDLQFDGPTNVISGKLSGAGQISFGAGVTSLGAVSITAGTLGIYGAATVNLQANLTDSHAFNDSSNGVTTLNLGAHALTLAGVSAGLVGNAGAATVTGSGTFSNQSVLTLSNAIFGGTVKVSNAATIDQTGQVIVGDGGGAAPTITNLGPAVYDFTDDADLGVDNATAAFINQGLLEKTGGVAGQSSVISLAVTNSGTISALTGALDFNSSLVNTGTISGAGLVRVTGAGALTLNAGSVLSVAGFCLFDTASLTLGASLTYAGVFDDTSNGSNLINLAGKTLTLSGNENAIVGAFGVADLGGAGKLANSGTVTLGNAVVDGTVQIDNTGTINQNANITIGGGGGQVASVVNARAAHFNVIGGFTIGNGTATASHFNNSGAVTVRAGLGTATFATTFNNLAGGVIDVATGALENAGILVNAGTISGARLELRGSSQTTLAAGSTLSVGEVDLYDSALLTLGASATYSGSFVDASNGNNEINLGASTLTLKGLIDLDPNFGADLITGSGTLALAHAATLEGGGTLVVGGTAHLDIEAKTTVTGSLEIGDSSANAARAVVTAAGVYDLTADIGVSRGASAASTFTNAGLFEKTAGTGNSVVSVDFVNNGTITVTSGTLEFLKGTLTNHGTINGTVSFDGNGNELITAAAAAVRRSAAPAHAPGSAAQRNAGSPGALLLLSQAAAMFGIEQGATTFSGGRTAGPREAHLDVLGVGHLRARPV